MLPAIAKYVGGKVVTAVLVVASIIVVIWYYRLPVEARTALWASARDVLVWIGFVAVLPWATFFVPVRAVKAESNFISALTLVAYLVVDIVFALFLSEWSTGGAWQAAAMTLGFLCATVYNFVVCDFIADRLEASS